ncbi:MAG: hypothetical protein ACRDSR_00760 [Pseudonocardiaceae bacterium]
MPSDRSRDLLDPGTAGTDINPPPPLTKTETVAAVRTEEFGYIRGRVRHLPETTGELHRQSHYAEWNARTNTRGRTSTQEMLDGPADLGFAWRDVVKLLDVSVAAIQK